MKIALPILLTLVYTALMLYAGVHAKRFISININNSAFLSNMASYQVLLIGISVLSIVVTYFLNPSTFSNMFKFGEVSAIGEELKLMGIKKGDSWLKTGLSLSFVITVVTAVFMYFQMKKFSVDWSMLTPAIVWILLFSITNAFSEEMIYRLGVVVPLFGEIKPIWICTISAILFGIAHINGNPSGIIGITLAGILGFVLSKSMLETKGFFWAWFIHFLQDVVILVSVYLMNSKS